MAVARPILQLTSQPASVMVVTEELRTGLECGPSVRRREVIGVGGTFPPVGAPTDAPRLVAEVCADGAPGRLCWGSHRRCGVPCR